MWSQHARTHTHTPSCPLGLTGGRETSFDRSFLQSWRTLFLWEVKAWPYTAAISWEWKKRWGKKRKNDRGREGGRQGAVTAGGNRMRRPLVLGGVGLSTSSGGQQQQQLSCLSNSDEAADSHLHESSRAILLQTPPPPSLLVLYFHLDSFSQREGIPPLRPLSSALRQSDCWTCRERWDILN